MLPELRVIDNVVSAVELARWKSFVESHQTQSTSYLPASLTQEPEWWESSELFRNVIDFMRVDLPLIHCLVFAIKRNHETEMHRDVGEYAALFYPFTNLYAPLMLENDRHVVVRENRLVLLDATKVTHRQGVPENDSTRYSVAFKFRLPGGA